MNKTVKFILVFLLIAVILGVFAYIIYNDNKIEYVTKDNYLEVIAEDDYVMIYFGEEFEEINDMFREFEEEYMIQGYYMEASLDEAKQLLGNNELENTKVYGLYVEGNLVSIIDTEVKDRIVELIRKYLYGEIPADERYYKVLSTANEYIKKVNSKDITMAVFGATSCTFCTVYLPVINEIAEEEKLDIYYFDFDTYDANEYDSIMNLNLTLPGKCTKNGEDTILASNFPKPMTIFTKNGEIIDCIRGYVVKDVVLDKLEELKIIKEK